MYAGFAGAAAFVKRSLPSRGDEESDEVALVAIFDGVTSGGVAIDAPDPGDPAAPMLTLDGFALFGGIAVGARAADAAFA